jgi:predicted RNA binding protein YcfA (HicA-like mRNA interferase family)
VAFAGNVWNQLKNLTAGDLAYALSRDGWTLDTKGGSQHIYLKSGRRVSVHIHPQKTFGAKLLKALLEDTGWTEADMKRLKLIK